MFGLGHHKPVAVRPRTYLTRDVEEDDNANG